MSWLTGRPTSFDTALGLRAELWRDYQAFESQLWSSGVEPALLELCRLRVATILGCAGELRRRAAALDERLVAALDRWAASEAFSPLQRAALRLTDGFVLDPHGVSDADAAALAAHLSPAQMVALIEALAVFDGFTRFRLMLGVDA
jgi:alkylhydroperoxidase family enzyme